MIDSSSKLESILILTSNSHDSRVAADVLKEHSLEAYACKDYLDLNDKIVKGCGVVVLSDDALTKKQISDFQKILETQETWSDIPIILLTSKSVAQASELFSKSGNVSFLEAPFSRITLVRAMQVALRARRKQYEVFDLLTALNKSKEGAEKANTAKTEFLANMSHEIRTPIGAILGFLEIMKDPENKPEDNLNYMGVIERNSQQLLRLIDDILDLSKVEAGKMTIEKVPFKLGDLLNDINSIMSFKAAEKGVAYFYNAKTPLPEEISSDPVRLRQILGNILSNAIKFTTEGFVRLQAAYHPPYLEFKIQDTGLGISESQIEKLFKPFSQADMSTTRKYGGTGLGLILSKRLSESLGGGLILEESALGKGSTFYIKIKPTVSPGAKMLVNKSKAPETPPFQKESLKDLKVLLVEDSPDNQMLIFTLLSSVGAKVTVASNGQEGVDLALKENFDVVLMDVQMPVMDGHEATKKLREVKYQKPIIALTAHAMDEEKKKCYESGYTEFLTKPIRKDNLINMLSLQSIYRK
jgi:signal transduction histidine kinase